ncbi:MAG: aldolase [Methanosarcinales archaeon]|nr:aldolase [Methanosarcinales archaeon]
MAYSIVLMTIDRKQELAEKYADQVLYEVKSEIYGCCIKLLTGEREVRDRWMDSFYNISQSVRSHGRLYVVQDPADGQNQVYYDPQSKTAFLVNVDYYGWVKSLALSVAGDVLEDEHSIYSVHGACLDVEGRGLAILGGSGAGKTTHTYGLLRDLRVRVVSDDWFFCRVYGRDILAFGSEKNFYIRSELAGIWKEFAWLVERSRMDAQGRGVIDLRWAVGKGRILPLTTLYTLIILKRDDQDREALRRLEPAEALRLLEEGGYFNPHLLVKTEFKHRLRNLFFLELLERVQIWQVNTVGSPEESQELIRQVLNMA